MRLSHRDFDALQAATLDLYAHRDMAAFKEAVPRIFVKVIPSEYFGVMDIMVDKAKRHSAVVDLWESSPRLTADMVARGERVAIDHPFTKYSMKTCDPTALKLSDFFTLRELRGTTLYNEFYRHAGIQRLLGVASFAGPGLTTLNSIRTLSERDFTERDRLVMNLLRPHFDQARRNAERVTARLVAKAQALEVYDLTPRERHVAQWLAKGKTNLEISTVLGVRPRTVEKHVENILGKLGVENRTAAALLIAGVE